jgi:cytochrome P450
LVALLIGGHHSTAAAIAGLINHVLEVPGLHDTLLADPELIPQAIEESLRLTTPLQMFARTATTDTEVAGTRIPQGGRIMLNYAAANRDETVFEDADRFQLDRTNNRHLAFGHGIHLCIGRPLARAELRICLEELLSRVPNLQLVDNPPESGLTGGHLMSLTYLRVSFTPDLSYRATS